MNNQVKKLKCLRDVKIQGCVTIYNTPKGLTSDEFIKESVKYPKWWETRESRLTFSKGDIVELIACRLPTDHECFTIKVIKCKTNPVKTERFMFEHQGFKEENEEVFLSINEEAIQFFCDTRKLPKRIKTNIDHICKMSDKILTRYDVSEIKKLDETIYKISANILYGSDNSDYYKEMSKDILIGIKALFENYFKVDVLVCEIAHTGRSINPDRIGIDIIIFACELTKENLKNGAKQLLNPEIKIENCRTSYSWVSIAERDRFNKMKNESINIIKQKIIDFL